LNIITGVDSIKIPNHLGVIPDGNRRFAKRLMENPNKGHEWGSGKFAEVFEWCRELGIKNLTFYTLSLENLHSRPRGELNFLVDIARREMEQVIRDEGFIHEHKIRLNVIGRTDLLEKDVQETIRKAVEATRDYNDYTLNLAVAYGGRQEITEAARRIGIEIASGKMKPEDVTEEVIRQKLWTHGTGDPDLIIRTGGEKRLSNFMLFQSAYSELAFIDTLWPELSRKEFMKIIEDYGERDRRFGK
jgi:tritrans,polycis-undecaprenyl-diphosphate synthase [geranylgeranyl-diphosphate specific]